MSYPLPKCDYEHCTGHLGKFQSCQDEALYELSMSGFEESTGDTDFEGHFTIIVLDEDESVSMGEGWVTVPAGSYIVESSSSGAVYVSTGTWLEMRQAFDAAAMRYETWLELDEDQV